MQPPPGTPLTRSRRIAPVIVVKQGEFVAQPGGRFRGGLLLLSLGAATGWPPATGAPVSLSARRARPTCASRSVTRVASLSMLENFVLPPRCRVPLAQARADIRYLAARDQVAAFRCGRCRLHQRGQGEQGHPGHRRPGREGQVREVSRQGQRRRSPPIAPRSEARSTCPARSPPAAGGHAGTPPPGLEGRSRARRDPRPAGGGPGSPSSRPDGLCPPWRAARLRGTRTSA